MIKIFIPLFLILSFFWKAQAHRFIYEVHFKSDSTQTKTDSLNMVLEIGKEETKFYDYNYLVLDSLEKNGKANTTTSIWGVQLLKRKTGNGFNINYKHNMFDYYLIETKDEIIWKINSETKKLGGYHLQKAETDFGGRHWIAWFAKEIPIQEGPYKFTGLPGLILEISDSRNHYSYKLVSSHQLEKDFDTTKFLETNNGRKPIKITEEKLLEIKLNYYNDPYSWAKSTTGTWTVDLGDGKIYSKKEDIPHLTRNTQAQLRTDNNPIELDKAIRYPVK